MRTTATWNMVSWAIHPTFYLLLSHNHSKWRGKEESVVLPYDDLDKWVSFLDQTWVGVGGLVLQHSVPPTPGSALVEDGESWLPGTPWVIGSEEPLNHFLFSHNPSFFPEGSRNVFLVSIPQAPSSFFVLFSIISTHRMWDSPDYRPGRGPDLFWSSPYWTTRCWSWQLQLDQMNFGYQLRWC